MIQLHLKLYKCLFEPKKNHFSFLPKVEWNLFLMRLGKLLSLTEELFSLCWLDLCCKEVVKWRLIRSLFSPLCFRLIQSEKADDCSAILLEEEEEEIAGPAKQRQTCYDVLTLWWLLLDIRSRQVSVDQRWLTTGQITHNALRGRQKGS